MSRWQQGGRIKQFFHKKKIEENLRSQILYERSFSPSRNLRHFKLFIFDCSPLYFSIFQNKPKVKATLLTFSRVLKISKSSQKQKAAAAIRLWWKMLIPRQKFQVNIAKYCKIPGQYCKKYCENIAKFQVNRWERDGLREPWGSQEVLRFQNQLLLLFSWHQLLQPLHLRPLDPRSKRASKSHPSSLQWMNSPIYNNFRQSSFSCQKKENSHQRQFLTRVIDLHWLIFAVWRHCLQPERGKKCVEKRSWLLIFKPSRFTKILLCQASKIVSSYNVPNVRMCLIRAHIRAQICAYL